MSVTFQGRPKPAAQTPVKEQQKSTLNPPAQQQEARKAAKEQGDSFVRFGCSSC